jgi:thiol-disulfide isomerase/thioredoxin
MFNPESPPEITAAEWFNADTPPTLKGLKGKVVVIAAFQTHCPGSIKHGLPQASRLMQSFSDDEVSIIGLNVPFEEHDKQTPAALKSFIEENDLEFPIALDKPNGSGLPKTFEAYELQGTPAILIFDRQGRLRRHYLGAVDDLRLGAEIMALAIESRDAPREQSVALERRLAATLTDPNAHHHHEGGCCGGHGHHHHDHDHAHEHGGGCCGGQGHDHSHEHHAHGGEGCCGGAHHAHDHGHDHGQKAGKGKSGKSGGCNGDGSCGCNH